MELRQRHSRGFMIVLQPHWNRIVVALTAVPSFKVSSTVNQPATEPIVDFVSQLKMNWGELKRNVLFPFAPIVGEYSKTQGGTLDDAGGTVLPVVGHACINLRVLRSLIGFPLASSSSHLRGTDEP